jgi:ATPase subunit of ABC transporter with duplicated ATPase domains
MIEKIEMPDIKQSSRRSPSFHFKPRHPSGKQVLCVKNLGKQFKTRKLFSHLHFEINRGEKIAIIGENGVGKSTLIKILINQIQQDEGTYEWGHETHISYFSQDHHDLLNSHTRVLDWFMQQVSNVTEQQVRKTLGHVLFPKDEAEKDILSLSGGEAARLLLAKIVLELGNVLILDEPTNHLDIEATEALAHALSAYTGTLILVSHDRHFIHKVANRILCISHEKGLQDFRGDIIEFEKQNDV